MDPARPDGQVDARTERFHTAPAVDFDELAQHARDHGLVWLRDHVLSDPADPEHLTTLLAVMRLDLDFPGTGSSRLTEYRRVFTTLRTTPEGRRAIQTLEDGYARRVPAVTPRPATLEHWFRVDAATENTPPPELIERSSVSVERSVSRSVAGPGDAPELDPTVAAELGFTELVRLGQGGFGTVYAARQPSVGNRLVAIKYTAARSREPQVLAALQHPNIMPVWSVHEYAGHRVFCMPLHGRTTLADVLRMIDQTKSLPATGAGFLSAASVTQAEADLQTAVAEPPLELAADAPEYESDRRRLEKLGYVESVVQGVTRLADALAHAHRRRVVHLDIKPANILITDDGGFMILDFGLAYQNGVAASTEAGGTVRYMAPEQLTTFVAGQRVRPDPRMDLYALGLVFFELLTGRHPFAESLVPGVRREEWVAARHRQSPRVRRFNPTVPPGVEAIVLKLLDPDRTRRYQSAEQVLADLTRQQDDQPLIHATNPSVWERFVKFRRRHPVFSVAVMAVVLAALAVGGFWIARQEAKRAQTEMVARETETAEEQLAAVLADQTAARIDAGAVQSATSRQQAVAAATRWRTAYGIDPTGEWQRRPAFTRLNESQQRELMTALGEQALLAAHAERLNAAGLSANDALAALERAVEWNRRAEGVFGPHAAPAAVGEQRTALARRIGRPLPALPAAPPDDLLDLYLRGLGRIADGHHHTATAALEELVLRDPQHAAGQFALGYVYQSAGRYRDAAERYQVAKALAPRDYRAPYNRGSLQLYFHRQPDEAVSDLTTAIDRNPLLDEAYFLRATARYQLVQRLRGPADQSSRAEKLALAMADLNQAIALSGERYRYLSLRSLVRAGLGDAAGSTADQRSADELTPTDEIDYTARGTRRAREQQTAGAMADFALATKRNPQYVTAWNNLAALQAATGRTREAAESYEHLIRLMPEYTTAKFKRAVLLARLGDRDTALAQIAGLNPPDAECWFQQAAVYALGAAINLNDRTPALFALQAAARGGWVDWDDFDKDPDFDHVRDLDQFLNLRKMKGRPVE